MSNDEPRYVEPTPEGAAAFATRATEGPIVMLNLLRFRAVADYNDHPTLVPPEPISGADAYRRYMAHGAPFFEAVEGEIQYAGEGGPNLIGPEHDRWDLMLLVRYPSKQAFLDFVSNPGYRAGLGHRVAALEDSRLLPLEDAGAPWVG